MNQIITAILDFNFTGPINDMIHASDIWIVESGNNLSLIQNVWNSTWYNDPKNMFELTSFKAFEGESPQKVCERILDEIDMHYQNWTEIKVMGIELTEEIKNKLEDIEASMVVLEEGAICAFS